MGDDKVYRVRINKVKSDDNANLIALIDELWLFNRRKAGKSKLTAQALVQQQKVEQP